MIGSFCMHVGKLKTYARAATTICRIRSVHRWGLGLALGCLASISLAQVPEVWPTGLRSTSQRIGAIKAFADGITRNDAEAFNVGWQGRTGWNQAVRQAERDASLAEDPESFGLVLRRLYAR